MSISFSLESVGSVLGASSDTSPHRFVALPFPFGHFKVLGLEGRERLSKPYRFDVTVVSSLAVGEDMERLVLGQRCVLMSTLESVTRVFPGIIASVRSRGCGPRTASRSTGCASCRRCGG